LRSSFHNRPPVLTGILCFIYFLLVVFLLLNSCKKLGVAKATCNYNSDIKPIVSARCALSGCHGAGSTIADFTDYAVLKACADSGWIRNFVFNLKIMPPASADSLNEQQKEKIKCWLDNGALQN
jgi:hypothetical protein